MLEERIDDQPFLRLIGKWLGAGILETDGQVVHPVTGTPKGGIVSPVLANIYLIYWLGAFRMDAIKLMLAFAPWIAFWIISLGHSMLWLKAGICVAALLVVVMGVTRLHRGIILWAGVAFFAFAVIYVAWRENMWVVRHLGFLASGTLFLATFLSMFLGQPFTESYARDHVPKELWDSPSFIRGCFTVTGAWGFVFLANTLINVVKLQRPAAADWIYEVAQLGFLGLGVLFTTIFSRIARQKRGQTESVVKK